MDFVNTLSTNLVGHRQGSNAPAASVGSLLHDGTGGAQQHSAASVSACIVELLKTTLAEAESYLAVFEQRVKLEEDYVRGLKGLVDKSRDAVARLDVRIASTVSQDGQRTELPQARRAWKEMLDNHLRELDTRTHYLETVKQGVIAPFAVYRDAQERIRKRVKEDLKTSVSAYEEMRSTTLPRAKRVYEKKCEEVEQLRLQQIAIEEQKLLLSQSVVHGKSTTQSSADERPLSHVSSTEEDSQAHEFGLRPDAPSPSRSGSSRSRPGDTATRHVGSDTSDTSAYTPGTPGMSPRMGNDAPLSSSDKKGHFLEALRPREAWDAAKKEGPKKLNAFISRMREGGSSSDQHGSAAAPETASNSNTGASGSLNRGPGSLKSNQNLQLKNVKAKREAEEADKAYRKAIFDLETLRMRRQKTITAAKASVIEARRELYLTCQAVWQQAGRSTQWLCTEIINSNLDLDKILSGSLDNLESEMKRLEAVMPVVEDEPVSYVNFHYGECKSLIFGVSLTDYAFSRAQKAPPHLGPPKAEAPVIVQKCIRFIEDRALDQPGIYRTSAKHTAIQNLAHALERDEERFAFSATDEDPSTVAGVLKLYLRQLPEPVLPMPWEERVRYTHERQEQIQTGFASLKGRIRRLPNINQATLRVIVEHLAKVASHAEQNKMTPSNLSIIFGPLLLSQVEHDATSIAAAMEEDRVTEDLILYADTIFDLTHAGAPVLPQLSATAGTGKTWDLNEGQKGTTHASTPNAESSASSPPMLPARPRHHAQRPSFGAVPLTAEGAYLPPPPDSMSASEQNEDHGSTIIGDEASSRKSDTTSALPAIDTSGAVRPSSQSMTGSVTEVDDDDEVLPEQGNDKTDDVQAKPSQQPPTPLTASAIATPITALSSANASLGHER